MAKLSMMAQETVIRLYKGGEHVRKPQGHIANMIDGISNLLEKGVEYGEIVRLQTLSAAGDKISYVVCKHYANGTCHHGNACRHAHVMDQTVPMKGKGKAKGSQTMEDAAADEFLGWA